MNSVQFAQPNSPGVMADKIGWIDFGKLTLSPNQTIQVENSAPNGYVIAFDMKNITIAGNPLLLISQTSPSLARAAFGNTGYVGIPGDVVLYSNFPAGPTETEIEISNITVTDASGKEIKNYQAVVANAEVTAIISSPTTNGNTESFALASSGIWELLDNLPSPAPNPVGPVITGEDTNSVLQTGIQTIEAGPTYGPVFITQAPASFVIDLITGRTGKEGFAIGFVIDPPPCEQAITDLIESVALEQTALSHILNAEGEKIQKAAALQLSVDGMLKINKSAAQMLSSVTRLEMVLQSKLELFKARLCTDTSPDCTPVLDTDLKFAEDYGPINTITKIDKNNYSIFTVEFPIDVIVTTTPAVPIAVVSIDPTLSFSGNTLTIITITSPDPKYAVLQIGEGNCAELLTIEVVTGG